MNSIKRVSAIILDIPIVRPHVLAMTTMQTQSIVLVFIQRSDGIRGVGEATTIGGLTYGEESPEGIKVAIDTYLAPLLIGMDADRPAVAMARIKSKIVGNRFAKCAVETALFDAAGQAADLPISEFLGGRCTDRLPVAWTLASGDTSHDIEEGEALFAARRHNIFKIKIGRRSVAEDCNHVSAIARAFQGRADIRVDVNQYWSRNQAIEAIVRLQDVGVRLIEQPLAKDDYEGMKLLSRKFDSCIMADESLVGPASAWRLAKTCCADAFSIKISQSGGLNAARDIGAIAGLAHVGIYGGTMLECGIGTAASAQLFATFPNLEWGTELFGPLLLCEDILTQPLKYSDFALEVPSGPGLGVKVDDEKLRKFARNKSEAIAFAN